MPACARAGHWAPLCRSHDVPCCLVHRNVCGVIVANFRWQPAGHGAQTLPAGIGVVPGARPGRAAVQELARFLRQRGHRVLAPRVPQRRAARALAPATQQRRDGGERLSGDWCIGGVMLPDARPGGVDYSPDCSKDTEGGSDGEGLESRGPSARQRPGAGRGPPRPGRGVVTGDLWELPTNAVEHAFANELRGTSC